MKTLLIGFMAALLMAGAWSKIPAPPVTDDSKAKAAEAAAKTAHGNAVANFQLCKSMDATAAFYGRTAKAAGKDVKPPTATPPCADPGAFVYPPPAAGAAPAALVTPAAPVTAAAGAKAPAAGAKPVAPGAPAAPAVPAKKS